MKYNYKARVLRVMDGDTVKLSIRLKRTRAKALDLGCHVFIEDGYICLHSVVRMLGMNAPEKGTPEGKESWKWLATELPVNLVVDVATKLDATERWGRLLGTLTRLKETKSINELSVESGHSVAWDGKGKKP